MLDPSAPTPADPPIQPPAPPSRGRPSWSDGTFAAVVLLLLVAFLSGFLLGGANLAGGQAVGFAPASGSAGASPVGTLGPGHTMPAGAPANFDLFWSALQLVREHFVDQSAIDPQQVTYGAIEGLVDALGDPGHTVFLTPQEVKAEQQVLQGSIVGIGVFLGVQAGQPVIQSVISGTPAARSGLQAGDLIVSVDGKPAAGLSTEQIADLVRGKEGTKVTLTIIHPNTSNPIDVTITRQTIEVPAVTWALVPGTKVAMVRIVQFSNGAGDQALAAVKAARAAGATKLILDLRSDPGGLVDEAVAITSQFIGKGDVYIRQQANGDRIPVPVKGGGTALDIPLVVLVDYGTASSAEIVAGAIQDAGRGKLVGTRTFGTGTVLNTFPLPDGSALRLAVEEWLTPKGRHIFPDGIAPDQKVDLGPGVRALEPGDLKSMVAGQLASSKDAQLLEALRLLGASPGG